MAINTTKTGGIYIEIGGDAKPLYQVLDSVKTYSNQIAGGISLAFNDSMSAVDTSKVMNDLTKSFAQMKTGLQGATANVAQFEKNFQDMGRQIGLAQSQTQAFGQTMAAAFKRKNESDVTSALRAIQRQAGLTNAEMEKLAKTMGAGSYFKPMKNADSGFSVANIGKMAISSAAAYLSISSLIGGVKALNDAMLQMSRLGISYSSVFGGAAGAQSQLDYIYDKTQAIGLQFQETADTARGFFAASQGTTLQKDMNNIFEAVANSAAALQMSTDDVNGVFRALGQIVSKGKVQAEELRGQLGERLPGAFQIAAKAMGMSTAELDKFMADGKLTAEDLLPKLAQVLKDKYAKAAEEAANSVQGSINRMSSEWEIFKANILDSEMVVGMLNRVTAALKLKNDAERQATERTALISQLKSKGIQGDIPLLEIDSDGNVTGSNNSLYSERLLNWQKEQNEKIAAARKTAEDAAKDLETRLSKASGIIKDYLKNDKEAKTAAAKEEYDAAMKANKEQETEYIRAGVSIERTLSERVRIEAEYQRKIKEINEKGTGGAKSLANKQFKFDTGLDQLRQEVANMEATINPAAVGIDKLRQKLELEKQNALAAAEAHYKLSVQRKEASPAEAGERQALEIRKAELTYAQKIADAEEKGRQVRVDFYKDFASLSGNYVDSINAQIEAIRRQAEEYRNAGISDELVKQWEGIKQLESARDPMSGTILSLQQWTNEASNQAKNYGEAWRSASDMGVKALTDLAMGAEVSAQEIARSFARMFLEIQAKSIMAGVTGGLGNLFSGLFAGGVNTSAAGTDLIRSNTVAFGVGHSGGLGGSLPSYHIALPSSVIDSAPRFHGGTGPLKSGERAAVILDTERVLSPAETRAFDAAMLMAGSIPKSLAQGSGRSGGYSSSAQPQVFVNIQNNTGAEVSQRTRTDNMGNKSIEVMIGDAVAKQTAKPGTPMNRVVRQTTGGRTRTEQQ